jgi:PKD repeat protein
MKSDPQDSYVAVGQTFTVNVSIVDVSNLTAWMFTVYFRNSVLNCVNASEGPFLSAVAGPYGTTFIKRINNTFSSTYGAVDVGCSLLGSNVSASGSGVLATIEFEAMSEANSPLDLQQTELDDDQMPPQLIPHTLIDGTVHVIGTPVTVSIQPSNLSGSPGWININETFTVNVTIAMVNDLAYWQVGMSFNPTVLECLGFLEGPFLMSVGSTTWQQGTIDNQAGLITPYGASLAGGGASGNGTLGFLTFKVKNTGSSTLHLQDALLLDSNYATIAPFSLVHGHFELPSETPKPPTAYFTYWPLSPYVGELITFNASESQSDGETIVSYVWSFGDASQGNGMITNHTYTDPGQYNVTLTVTDEQDLTGSFSIVLSVTYLPQGAAIDIYTQRGGTGFNQPSDSFARDELMAINAYVTYNLAPVAQKIVAFEFFYPNGTLAWSRASETNEAGIAFVPYPIGSAIVPGSYWINVTATIAGSTVADTCRFKIGWLLEVLEVIPCNSKGAAKNGFRHGEPLYVTLEIQNIRFHSLGGTIIIGVVDDAGYPIMFFDREYVFPVNHTTLLVYVGSIPLDAIPGSSEVSSFATRGLGGVPFCPEKQSGFIIACPEHPDVAVTCLEAAPNSTYVGHSIEVVVSLLDEYLAPQSCSVSLYANDTLIETIPVSNLAPFVETNFSCIWNTYHFSPGTYLVSAQASVVPGEIETDDNFLGGKIVALSARTVPVHDIGVAEFEANKTIVGVGYLFNFSITVENQGDYTESLNLTILANEIELARFSNLTMTNGDGLRMVLFWNTTGFAKGYYNLTTIVELSQDSDSMDNTLVCPNILVSLPGDLNGDKFVNAKDAVVLGTAFNSHQGESAYKPNADINDDCYVNAKDAVILGRYFNQSW